jgi:hypothetical protein
MSPTTRLRKAGSARTRQWLLAAALRGISQQCDSPSLSIREELLTMLSADTKRSEVWLLLGRASSRGDQSG